LRSLNLDNYGKPIYVRPTQLYYVPICRLKTKRKLKNWHKCCFLWSPR